MKATERSNLKLIPLLCYYSTLLTWSFFRHSTKRYPEELAKNFWKRAVSTRRSFSFALIAVQNRPHHLPTHVCQNFPVPSGALSLVTVVQGLFYTAWSHGKKTSKSVFLRELHVKCGEIKVIDMLEMYVAIVFWEYFCLVLVLEWFWRPFLSAVWIFNGRAFQPFTNICTSKGEKSNRCNSLKWARNGLKLHRNAKKNNHNRIMS